MKKITELLGLKPDATEDQIAKAIENVLEARAALLADNEALIEENKQLKAAGSKKNPKEALIQEKVRAGLSREMAIEVLDAQEKHDARLAAEEKAAPKSEKKKGNEPV